MFSTLKPEAHDKKMEELLSYSSRTRNQNALDIVEKLDDPHIDDDFHRFLVQYYFSAGNVRGLSEGEMLFGGINMEALSHRRSSGRRGERRKLKEYISRMEQFYAECFPISDTKDTSPGKNILRLNWPCLTVQANSPSTPPFRATRRLFLRNSFSLSTGGNLTETTDDYNVFCRWSNSGALGVSSVNEIFPLKHLTILSMILLTL